MQAAETALVAEALAGAASANEAVRSASAAKLEHAEQERPGFLLAVLLTLAAAPDNAPEIRLRASLHCRNVFKRAWSRVPVPQRSELLVRFATAVATQAEQGQGANGGASGFPHLPALVRVVVRVTSIADWATYVPSLSLRLMELFLQGDGVAPAPTSSTPQDTAGPLLHAMVKEMHLRRWHKDTAGMAEALLAKLAPVWAAETERDASTPCSAHVAGRWKHLRYLDGTGTLLLAWPGVAQAWCAQLGQLFRARAQSLTVALTTVNGNGSSQVDSWFAKDLRCLWKGWARLVNMAGTKGPKPGLEDEAASCSSAKLAAHTLALCCERRGDLDKGARQSASFLHVALPQMNQEPGGFLNVHAAELVVLLVRCLRLEEVELASGGEDIEEKDAEEIRSCVEYGLRRLLAAERPWTQVVRSKLRELGEDVAMFCLGRFPEAYPEVEICKPVLEQLHSRARSLDAIRIVRLCRAVESLSFRFIKKIRPPLQKEALQALLVVMEDPRADLPLVARVTALEASTQILLLTRSATNGAKHLASQIAQGLVSATEPPGGLPPTTVEELAIPAELREAILRNALRLLVVCQTPEAQQRCLQAIQVEAQHEGFAAAEALLARWQGNGAGADLLARHGVLDVVQAVLRAPWHEEPPPQALIRAAFQMAQDCVTRPELGEFRERGQQLLLGLLRAGDPARDGLDRVSGGVVPGALEGLPDASNGTLDDARSATISRDLDLRWCLFVEAVALAVLLPAAREAHGVACTRTMVAICRMTQGFESWGNLKLAKPLQWKLLQGVLCCMLIPGTPDEAELLGLIPNLLARFAKGELPMLAAAMLVAWQQRHQAHFVAHCPAELAAVLLDTAFDTFRSFPVRCAMLQTVVVILRREGERVSQLPVVPRFFERCAHLVERVKGDPSDKFFFPMMPCWPSYMYQPGMNALHAQQPYAKRVNLLIQRALIPLEFPDAMVEKPVECSQALRALLFQQVTSYVQAVPGAGTIARQAPQAVLEVLALAGG